MARPRKNTVDYFPHSCVHGKTMFILEDRYGNDGYAAWFKILETLGSSEGHFIDCRNPAVWLFLQAKTRLSEAKLREIIDLLAKIDSIDPEMWEIGVIWCQKFVDGIADVYKNRKIDIPQKPCFLRQKPLTQTVSYKFSDQPTPENPQTKVKETKLEEKRGCVADPAAPGDDGPAPLREKSAFSDGDTEPPVAPEPEPLPANQGQDSQPEEKIAKPPPPPKFGPAQLASLWNELGCRPAVSKLSDVRRRKITARLRQRADPAWWRELIVKVQALQARGRQFLTFDFIIGSENNLLKVVEGNYDEDFETGKKRAIAGNHQQRGEGEHYFQVRSVQPNDQLAAG